MVSKVWKSGNSLVITISQKKLASAGMDRDTKVKVECVAPGELRIKKVDWDGRYPGSGEGRESEQK